MELGQGFCHQGFNRSWWLRSAPFHSMYQYHRRIKSTIRLKRIADSPIQNELGKSGEKTSYLKRFHLISLQCSEKQKKIREKNGQLQQKPTSIKSRLNEKEKDTSYVQIKALQKSSARSAIRFKSKIQEQRSFIYGNWRVAESRRIRSEYNREGYVLQGGLKATARGESDFQLFGLSGNPRS